MAPSGPHAPRWGSRGASHRVRTGPPTTSTRFNFPSAKNPIDRLSGDQNGEIAPSVPETACAVAESSRRIQSCRLCRLTNATRVPSGEITGLPNRGSWMGSGRVTSNLAGDVKGPGPSGVRCRIAMSDRAASPRTPSPRTAYLQDHTIDVLAVCDGGRSTARVSVVSTKCSGDDRSRSVPEISAATVRMSALNR